MSAGSAATSSPITVIEPDPESLLKSTYKAITDKNYFLLAGCLLSFVTIGVRWLLKKKWPSWEKDRMGVLLVGVLAGVGALAHAWLADAPIASSTTFLGALKVFVAAIAAYVTSKKLFGSVPQATVS